MFKRALSSLIAAATLLGLVSVAEAQTFPQVTLPPSTILGRLPGTAGPGEAIPFASLAPVLFGVAVDNAVLVTGPTGTAGYSTTLPAGLTYPQIAHITYGPAPGIVQAVGSPVDPTKVGYSSVHGTFASPASNLTFITPDEYIERIDDTVGAGACWSGVSNCYNSPAMLIDVVSGPHATNAPSALTLIVSQDYPGVSGAQGISTLNVLCSVNPTFFGGSGAAVNCFAANLIASWVSGTDPGNVVPHEDDVQPYIDANNTPSTFPGVGGGDNFTGGWEQCTATIKCTAGEYISSTLTTNGWEWGVLIRTNCWAFCFYATNSSTLATSGGIFVQVSNLTSSVILAQFEAGSVNAMLLTGDQTNPVNLWLNGASHNGSEIVLNDANATLTATYTFSTGVLNLNGTVKVSSTTINFAPSGNLAGTTDIQTLTNKTISGASNTLSNIANASLTNSAVTIGSTPVSLGATVTTFAGLVSVTSTTFVGALTGHASADCALATCTMTGGFFPGNGGFSAGVAQIYTNAGAAGNGLVITAMNAGAGSTNDFGFFSADGTNLLTNPHSTHNMIFANGAATATGAGGFQVGAPTGGDEGAGNINAVDYYAGGTAGLASKTCTINTANAATGITLTIKGGLITATTTC